VGLAELGGILLPLQLVWVSAPCGFTARGLPVGLQIVGRRFDDLGVLQASAAFEAARPWHDRRPPLATSP
jgi:Asp-tRNA(Asn)/Glu-tRNA(Gln) amidotransferase A subunit family amidase